MARLNLRATHRVGMAAVMALEAYGRRSLDPGLHDLVRLRASRLNRCGYCIDLHTRSMRKHGEPEERIAALGGDPSAEDFTERELAALALTDAVTRLGEEGVDDPTWDRAAEHFTERELGNLVLAIATINVWNRVAIATRLGE